MNYSPVAMTHSRLKKLRPTLLFLDSDEGFAVCNWYRQKEWRASWQLQMDPEEAYRSNLSELFVYRKRMGKGTRLKLFKIKKIANIYSPPQVTSKQNFWGETFRRGVHLLSASFRVSLKADSSSMCYKCLRSHSTRDKQRIYLYIYDMPCNLLEAAIKYRLRLDGIRETN